MQDNTYYKYINIQKLEDMNLKGDKKVLYLEKKVIEQEATIKLLTKENNKLQKKVTNNKEAEKLQNENERLLAEIQRLKSILADKDRQIRQLQSVNKSCDKFIGALFEGGENEDKQNDLKDILELAKLGAETKAQRECFDDDDYLSDIDNEDMDSYKNWKVDN